MTNTVRIDAHQHYWTTRRDDYGWLTPANELLYRDYEPAQLEELLERHGFQRTVAVQAAPTVEETYYLLELGDRYESLAGVVGWLDLEAADFPAQLEKLCGHPKFCGLRPMIQDLPSDWLLREPVVKHMQLLAEREFPVDLQLRPRLMESAVELMKRVPELRAVIDHIAKPVYDEEPMLWQRHMTELAAYPNVMCKLSGLVPEEVGGAWSAEQIEPYASYVLKLFGPDRVLFGSDWPVCLYSASYDEVVAMAERFVPQEWRERVFGLNAARFYRLG